MLPGVSRRPDLPRDSWPDPVLARAKIGPSAQWTFTSRFFNESMLTNNFFPALQILHSSPSLLHLCTPCSLLQHFHTLKSPISQVLPTPPDSHPISTRSSHTQSGVRPSSRPTTVLSYISSSNLGTKPKGHCALCIVLGLSERLTQPPPALPL